MKISALRLFNVKRFAGKGVAIEDIGDGVNVLCAPNEFGKSTSFEALHALFFQPHSGTPADVKNLRPYSGGNPMVEADIATADTRVRITKQYYGGRFARVTDLTTGRLIAQADEAENYIAALTRGGAGGPAGLLWVRQGITGIERRSRAEEDSEKQVRASLLESVQGEVEAITGGRRMAEIMARTTEALALYVTPTGRPKVGGVYASALDERERLAKKEEKLAAEVATLQEALSRRAAATARLKELEDVDARRDRRAAVTSTQAALDSARAQSERLKTADAELKLVRQQHDAATAQLAAFRAASQTSARLRQTLHDAEARRDQAAERRRQVVDAISLATAKVEAADIEEQQARGLLTRLDAALRARDAAERLEELRQRLMDAEKARRGIEDSEARLAALKLPDGALDRLQALEVAIARLSALQETARPSVSVSYAIPAGPEIEMNGSTLKDGETRTFDAQANLTIPGMGSVAVRVNAGQRSDGKLEKAVDERRRLRETIGVDGIEAARQRHQQWTAGSADLQELRARLALLAPKGLAGLREEVAARGAMASEEVEIEQDPAEARDALRLAETRRAAARQDLREVEPLRATADQGFAGSEAEIAALKVELAQADAVCGAEAERHEREAALAGAAEALQAELERTLARTEALRAATADLESVEAAARRARSVEDGAEKEIAQARETIAGLSAEIRSRSEDAVEEVWRETSEARQAGERRVAAIEREVALLQRLGAALDAARSEARDLYLRPVLNELRPLLALLFDDATLTFDEKTLLPQTILRAGLEEDVDRLSGGMREQLSVLTRLAFARLLARDGRPAPVILDDALVYSDDDRIEKMFDALHRQARDQQIIVFSCRQRAFAKLGGNVLRMADWQP